MSSQRAIMISQRNDRRLKKTPNGTYLNIRMTDDEKKKLQAAAAAEHRTVSNYIKKLIYDDIERKEKDQHKPE